MKIEMPSKVKNILDVLDANGYEAFVVGGCVRDSVLGKTPEDWDITTSAKPEEVKALFRRTIDTGIAHGTVTVMQGDDGFEITTYRVDGKYEDGRHPSEVIFTPDLKEDLLRRDFTINAMAYNEKQGLIDLYGGMEDIANKLIRCVGDADARFSEDALRILRAVRFAAQLDFGIEEETYAAIRRHAENLRKVSSERIQMEIVKLLVSPNPERWLDLYQTGITSVIMPEFDVAMATPQNSVHHMYSVGEHTLNTLVACRPDKILRLTMLLHDFGKPAARVTDSRGYDHFPGHADISMKIAQDILKRLKFDNETYTVVTKLIKYHDYRPEPEPAPVRRALNKIGEDLFPLFLEVQWADNSAKSEFGIDDKFDRVQAVCDVYEKIIADKDCVKLSDLKINGDDLLAMGAKGKEIGMILKSALDLVMEHPEKNEHDVLIAFANEVMNFDASEFADKIEDLSV